MREADEIASGTVTKPELSRAIAVWYSCMLPSEVQGLPTRQGACRQTCVRVRACVRACARARAFVRACMHAQIQMRHLTRAAGRRGGAGVATPGHEAAKAGLQKLTSAEGSSCCAVQ